MTEQFDPTRHRVFEVIVTREWRNYVVATDADEAEDLAAEFEDGPDAFEADVANQYVVSELRATVPVLDNTVPLGPTGWGRRQLTVNAALELVRFPEPVPSVTSTDELRHVGDWDWVRLAAGEVPCKPVLWAVRVAGGRAVATDKRRLHWASAPRPDGLWDAETGEPFNPTRNYPDVDDLVARTALTPGLELVVDADYLAEALLGAVGPDGGATRILLDLGLPQTPVALAFPDLDRGAVVAPLLGIHAQHHLNAHLRWTGVAAG